MLYRFLGTESVIGELRLSFGRKVELSQEAARDAILSRVTLIPDARATELGFTEDDFRIYADPVARQEATQDFKGKLHSALVHIHDQRVELLKNLEVVADSDEGNHSFRAEDDHRFARRCCRKHCEAGDRHGSRKIRVNAQHYFVSGVFASAARANFA